MRAITIYQPWASLIAVEAVNPGKGKSIETRSWYTSYRGLLAIHASKNTPVAEVEPIISASPMESYLEQAFGKLRRRPSGLIDCRQWANGCIVAVCRLVYCMQISDLPCSYTDYHTNQQWDIHPALPEYHFGDYTPDRYAWILDDIKALETPIPCSGSQRLWEWDAPAELRFRSVDR
jgi:hypothetical protein